MICGYGCWCNVLGCTDIILREALGVFVLKVALRSVRACTHDRISTTKSKTLGGGFAAVTDPLSAPVAVEGGGLSDADRTSFL